MTKLMDSWDLLQEKIKILDARHKALLRAARAVSEQAEINDLGGWSLVALRKAISDCDQPL